MPLDLTAGEESGSRLIAPPLPVDAEGVRRMCRERQGPRERDGTALPPGFLGTNRAIDASYLSVDGSRGRDGEDVQIRDGGMDLRLGAAVDALVAVLETRTETFTFHWTPGRGRLELWRDGVDVEFAEEPAVLPVAPTGGHRIEFGRLDDRLFFIVDGRADATTCVNRRSEWNAVRHQLPRGPRTRVFVAALGAKPLVVESLHVFRDVHHRRDPVLGLPGDSNWPIVVMPGHWYLLGDNSFDSRDSRQFGAVSAATYLGRPRFVLGPWPRGRCLTP